MIRLSSAESMRAADRHAIREHGVPSVQLMQRAGEATAEAAAELAGKNKTAAVFCGSGNNGGDGLAAASILLRRGFSVRAFLCGNRIHMTDDTAEMEQRLKASGGALEPFEPGRADITEFALSAGVIVDALIGIGLKRTASGMILDAIRLMNNSPAKVVSADMPSGVDADSGSVPGEAVYATVTVTFTDAKPGHFIEPGCTYAGEVRVVGIGVEEVPAEKETTFAVTEEDIRLPRRSPLTHKGNYGKLLILAGSKGYTGAPWLASAASVRSGSGLVFLGVPAGIYSIEAVKCCEAMPFPLPDRSGMLGADALTPILKKLSGCDVCLIGPGLGRSADVEEIVRAVVRSSKVPLILDADGINAVAGNIDILSEASCPLVLTPHAGEFARLGGDFSGSGRLAAARTFATAHTCILVLKGHRTSPPSPTAPAM